MSKMMIRFVATWQFGTNHSRLAAYQARAVRRRSAAGYRGENWLCDVLRIEAHFGKIAARLTRRALGGTEKEIGYEPRKADNWH